MSRAPPLFLETVHIFKIKLHKSAFHDYSFNVVLQFLQSVCEGGTPPTLISPVREPIHHILLLVSGCEAQRFAGHRRLVVDIAVKHIGLAWGEQTDSDNPLSKTVRLQASILAAWTECRTPSKSEWIISQYTHRGESQHILACQLMCFRWALT